MPLNLSSPLEIEQLRVVNSEVGFLSERYDLFIYPIGYEQRSSHIARKTVGRWEVGVGYVFKGGHIFSFDDNVRFAESSGIVVFGARGAATLVEAIKGATELESFSGRRVLFDVSSFNRRLIAELTESLLLNEFFEQCSVTFVYSLAKFREPPKNPVPFLDFSPIFGLEGWTAHPERPTVLIAGIGYDEDQAIGAVEYLDPSATFCFLPNGEEAKFRDAVERNNKALFDLLNHKNMHEYKIMFPYQTFWELKILVEI